MELKDVYPLQTLRATDSGGKPTYFRELFIFRGGVEIGNPQTGGVLDEYIDYYFIHVQEQDLSIHYWHKKNGVWSEVDPNLLPDLTQAQVGDRRFGAALDQNQRIIVSFERAGSIRVTRWNGSAYVQDISFPGINPAIFAEGLASRYIPGSDIVIFYQKTDDMSKIYTRLSSENFSTEREHIDYSEPIILDRVFYNRNDPYRYQILIADTNGEKFYLDDSLQGLRSELYPLRVSADSLANVEFKDFVFDNVVYQYFPLAASSSDFSLNSLVFDPTVYLYYPVAESLASIDFSEMTHNQIVQLYNPIAQSLFGVELAASSMQLVTIAYPYNPVANSQASIGLASFIMETV